MRDHVLGELRSIVSAIEVRFGAGGTGGTGGTAGRTSVRVTVSGHPIEPLDPSRETALGAPVSESPWVAGLLQAVYQGWYCRSGVTGTGTGIGTGTGTATNPDTGTAPAPAAWSQAGGQDLLPALRAANAGRERWDGGWSIAAVEADGRVAVEKGGQVRLVLPGEYVTRDGPGLAPRYGAAVHLRAPREGVDYQPGFYFAFSETLGPSSTTAAWVRLYWHVAAAAAPALVASLTSRLNLYQVPFRLKTLRQAAHYVRPDAAVLYVERRHYQAAAALAAEAYGEVAAGLRPAVPLFSKPLAPGLGVAEDPGVGGESFGWQRCRFVAEGLWRAAQAGAATAEDRLAAVVAHLEARGVDLDHPHLCRSRVDLYDPPAALRGPHHVADDAPGATSTHATSTHASGESHVA